MSYPFWLLVHILPTHSLRLSTFRSTFSFFLYFLFASSSLIHLLLFTLFAITFYPPLASSYPRSLLAYLLPTDSLPLHTFRSTFNFFLYFLFINSSLVLYSLRHHFLPTSCFVVPLQLLFSSFPCFLFVSLFPLRFFSIHSCFALHSLCQHFLLPPVSSHPPLLCFPYLPLLSLCCIFVFHVLSVTLVANTLPANLFLWTSFKSWCSPLSFLSLLPFLSFYSFFTLCLSLSSSTLFLPSSWISLVLAKTACNIFP